MTPPRQNDPRSALPAVHRLLAHKDVQRLIAIHSRPVVTEAIQLALERHRRELQPNGDSPTVDAVVAQVNAALDENDHERLRPVINASGIILHTGLGRAVLPQRAIDALAGLNRCANLQVDLESGARGKRNYSTEQLLCRLTGAEAAMVVNNNAAATLLVLAALCEGKEVIVSRGQLIEIGGSFRLPDCVRQSGAKLIEVGTTNKTHLRDYEGAITEETVAILRVNPSNYRIVGFSKSVSVEELATLKAAHPRLIVMDDLGCGALVDLATLGLPREPTVPESVKAGADISFFSGDKLIGGPQAGIIVGRAELIARIKKHPLTRMTRVCKLTDLALEQTLRLFLEPESLTKNNPTFAMLTAPLPGLKRKASQLAKAMRAKAPALTVRVEQGASATGGGSLPDTPIPTWVVAVSAPGRSAGELNRRLRAGEPPVIARVANDEVLLDMRTLLAGEEKDVLRALTACANDEN